MIDLDGFETLGLLFLVCGMLSAIFSAIISIAMRQRTLSILVKDKSKTKRIVINIAYFAIILPLLSLVLFAMFVKIGFWADTCSQKYVLCAQ